MKKGLKKFLKSWKPLGLFALIMLVSLTLILIGKLTKLGVSILLLALLSLLILQIYLLLSRAWKQFLLNFAGFISLLLALTIVWPMYSQIAATMNMANYFEPKVSGQKVLKNLHKDCKMEIDRYCSDLKSDVVPLTGCLFKKAKGVTKNKACWARLRANVTITVDSSGEFKGVKFAAGTKLYFNKGNFIQAHLKQTHIFNSFKCNKGYARFYGFGGPLSVCEWGDDFVTSDNITFDTRRGLLFLTSEGKVRQGILAEDTRIGGVLWKKDRLVGFDGDRRVVEGRLAHEPATLYGKLYPAGSYFLKPFDTMNAISCDIRDEARKPNWDWNRCEELVGANEVTVKNFRKHCKSEGRGQIRRSRVVIERECLRKTNNYACRPIKNQHIHKATVYYKGLDTYYYENAKKNCLAKSNTHRWFKN